VCAWLSSEKKTTTKRKKTLVCLEMNGVFKAVVTARVRAECVRGYQNEKK
jgi:hypothetical protein